jgi:hypothetical protein
VTQRKIQRSSEKEGRRERGREKKIGSD